MGWKSWPSSSYSKIQKMKKDKCIECHNQPIFWAQILSENDSKVCSVIEQSGAAVVGYFLTVKQQETSSVFKSVLFKGAGSFMNFFHLNILSKLISKLRNVFFFWWSFSGRSLSYTNTDEYEPAIKTSSQFSSYQKLAPSVLNLKWCATL